MTELALRHDRARVRRVAAAARRRALPAQADRVRRRALPAGARSRRRLRHRRARGAARAAPATTMTGARPVRGDARTCSARAAPEVDAVAGVGHGAAVRRTTRSTLVLTRRRPAPHRRRRTTCAARSPRWSAWRGPGGRVAGLGPQPAQPVLGAADGARVPQDTGEERLIPEARCSRACAAPGRRWSSSRQLGLVPDFVPPRALGAAAAVERAVERTPLIRRLCAHNVVLAAKPG